MFISLKKNFYRCFDLIMFIFFLIFVVRSNQLFFPKQFVAFYIEKFDINIFVNTNGIYIFFFSFTATKRNAPETIQRRFSAFEVKKET